MAEALETGTAPLEAIVEDFFVELFPEGDKYLSKIINSKDGNKKIEAIGNIADFLVENNFNSYHCYRIVVGKGWEAKLKWIEEHYASVLQPMEFNGYHVAQIVRNAGWEAKLKWIEEHYAFYKQNGLTNNKCTVELNAKDWKKRVVYWASVSDLFEQVTLTETRISPLIDAYLIRIIFNSETKDDAAALIQNCTYDNAEKFKEDVSSIAGITQTSNVDEVIAQITNTFGYSKAEIDMYLVAINKNRRGLLKWYNTGEVYPTKTITLYGEDQYGSMKLIDKLNIQQDSSLDIACKNDLKKTLLAKLRARVNGTYQILETVIDRYDGDISQLMPDEAAEFNIALGKIRRNRLLMGEIYELITK